MENDDIKCSSCLKMNRSIAVFCRFCGSRIPESGTNNSVNSSSSTNTPTGTASSPAANFTSGTASQSSLQNANNSAPGFIVTSGTEEIVGLKDLKSKVKMFIDRLEVEKKQKEMGLLIERDPKIIIFSGEAGTGKTLFAENFKSRLVDGNYVEENKIVVDTTRAFSKKYKDEIEIRNYISSYKPGLLCIDDVQDETHFMHEILLGLTSRPNNTICVISGTKTAIEKYFAEEHPDDVRYVEIWEFPNQSNEELSEILINKIKTIGYEMANDVSESLIYCIGEAKHKKGNFYKNGWIVDKLILKQIQNNQAHRLQQNMFSLTQNDYKTILSDDLPVFTKPKTVDEILATLDQNIGMEALKAEIRNLAKSMKVQIELQKKARQEGKKFKMENHHFIITGNPGTGKTTSVRLLGELFQAMGLLPTNKVVEKNALELSAGYVGQTKDVVNSFCDEAKGGILFIDEAYAIASGGFSNDAITTLLTRIENCNGEFICVAAGYKDKMENLYKVNEGFKSRFAHIIHIEDYNADELYQIFCLMAKQHEIRINPEAGKLIQEELLEIYENRDENFANGRTARNLFDKVKTNMYSRIYSEGGSISNLEIQVADVPSDKKKMLTEEEIFQKLDGMIGMPEVKEKLRAIYSQLQNNKLRAELGCNSESFVGHFILTGNPGTGKTTVSEILAEIFHIIGLLPTDKIVKLNALELSAGYVGQTKDVVNQFCDKAKGGVLFIDEAYAIATGGFSDEAVTALLTRIESPDIDFVVIAAGYKDKMEDFLNVNPGFPSRFKNKINIDDYNAEDLFKIFMLYVNKHNFKVAENAVAEIRRIIAEIYNNRSENFANARTIRNYYDNVIENLDSRIGSLPIEQKSLDVLTTITLEDIETGEVD